MKSKKNILRFDYSATSYKGWRLSVTRGGMDLVKYFSDREYGGVKKSYAAADRARLKVEKVLVDIPARVVFNGDSGSKAVRGVHRARTIGRRDERSRPA